MQISPDFGIFKLNMKHPVWFYIWNSFAYIVRKNDKPLLNLHKFKIFSQNGVEHCGDTEAFQSSAESASELVLLISLYAVLMSVEMKSIYEVT